VLELANRCAFAQEFRVGDDGDGGVGLRFPDDALDLVAGADRNRGFRHYHVKTITRRCVLSGRCVHVG
jgi:hypothetical protein